MSAVPVCLEEFAKNRSRAVTNFGFNGRKDYNETELLESFSAQKADTSDLFQSASEA